MNKANLVDDQLHSEILEDSVAVQIWTVKRLTDALEGRGREIIFRPSFQRGVVWDDERRKNLVESLKLKYPVGSLLFYEAGFEGGRIRYEIVDGLQRSKSLLDYSKNMLQDLTSGDVDPLFADEVIDRFNLVLPKHDIDDRDGFRYLITKETVKWLQGREVMTPAAGYSAAVLADRLAEVFGKSSSMAIVQLCETMLSDIKQKIDISGYEIPVIVFSGSRMKLPDIFARLNTGGIPLSKYDILGSIWDGREISTSRMEVQTLVKERQERLDAAAEIQGLKAASIAQGKVDFFDYLCAVGSLLSRNQPTLFPPARNAKEGEPEAHGFTLPALCFLIDTKTKAFQHLPNSIAAWGTYDAFLKALLEASELVHEALRTIVDTKIANEKTGAPHKELQIAAAVASVFRATGPKAVKLGPISIDDRLRFIVQHYLADAFRSYWSGSADSKALRTVRDDEFARPVSSKGMRNVVMEWHREQIDAGIPKRQAKNPKVDASTALFMKAYAASSGIKAGMTTLHLSSVIDPFLMRSCGLPFNVASNMALTTQTGGKLANVGPALTDLPDRPSKTQLEKFLDARFTAMVDQVVAHFGFV